MRTILERTNTEKGLRAVFIIAFLLLLLSYAISLFNNRELRKQAERVEHTNIIINLLDDMMARVKDAETGVRGYLIYRNISLLSPYFGSQEVADSIYLRLKMFLSDNPVQQGRLESLYTDIKTRFQSLREMIAMYNSQNREITDSVRSFQELAEKTMDRIRIGVSVLQVEENKLLNSRNSRMGKTFELVNLITFISVLLTLLLIVFGFITNREVNRARKRNMEEIAEYEQRLRQRIEELDKANSELVRIRSQEKFAATGRIARTIAHEVRNPLTNINLAADQLSIDSPNKDEQTAFLFDMITRNSNRINQLISDLLNSTKMPELSMEKVKASVLLEEALKDAEDRIRLRNAQVIKNYSEDAFVRVDRSKMVIAFLNIMINALEAMEQQPNPILSLATARTENKCQIMITDNGQGMSEEAQTRIFEPYFTSKSKGNGLGLTNTQNIILNHHGEISVRSEPGRGTSFIIILDYEG